MLNNMKEIEETLEENIEKSLEQTDLAGIFEKLSQIKVSITCSGVGGSMIPAKFAKKVLEKKNKICSNNCELLEILQRKDKVENVFLVSHSGKNYGIKRVIQNIPNSYLLSARKSKIAKENLLTYQEFQSEKSFISILNTILPMSILLTYYFGKYPQMKIKKQNYNFQYENTIEIFKDETTECSSTYLESVAIEANLGSAIAHDKYSFCHGRTTYTHYNSSLIIYLISKETKLDKMILNVLKRQKKNIIILNAEESDSIFADYKLTWMSLNLLIQMAEQKNIDLCRIKYAPFASIAYHYSLEDYA